jgi:hypothetical protein
MSRLYSYYHFVRLAGIAALTGLGVGLKIAPERPFLRASAV